MTVTNYKIYAVKPKLATNLITNPSFETTSSGGWLTGGTNTKAMSTEHAVRGLYSLKCTYSNNIDLAYYNIVITNTPHVAGVDIFVPSGYSGTNLYLYFSGFVGGSSTLGYANLSIRDRWQRIYAYITPDSGDLIGELHISDNSGNVVVGNYIYIDGVQLETGTVPTTYIDGDQSGNIVSENVLDYYWSGAVHASTSIRTANTRSGGELVDLETYCKIILTDGLGLPSVDNVSVPMTNGSKQYLYSNHKSEYFSIQVSFKGNELGDIMSSRNGFANLIKPNVTAYNEPLVLRYQGYDDDGVAASDPVNIKCNYVSGLDKSPLRRFVHFADITFELYEPTIQVDGEEAAELDFNDTLANADYIVKRGSDGVWSAMAGVTGTVYAIAQHPITKVIYIGGNFTNAGGDPNADYLAKWNGSTWVAVKAGLNGIVYALTFDASGNLYIGGAFTDCGDANGDYIVKLGSDGSTLTSLGTGLKGYCFALAIDNSGNLYVSSNNSLAVGGIAYATYIAKWDGTTWSALSTGLNQTVNAIVVDKENNVYIAGLFANIGDANGDGIVKWTGTAFESLGTGVLGGECRALAIDGNGNLYAGGDFGSVGGVANTAYIAKWNGQKWEAVGDSVNGAVYKLLIKNNIVYLSGSFTEAGDIPVADRIAVYIGNGVYKPLDINLPGTPNVYGLLFDNIDNLYVGYSTSGSAETAGDTDVTNSGKAKTYPIIEVTGTGLLRQIVNTTTGRGIYFNDLTLLSGEVITMDLRPDNITMVSSFRGSVKGYVLKGSNLDFPLIPGTNRIATFIDGTTDSNTKAVMKWTKHLHGVDGALYE